jgi:hypothetical protein
MTRLSDVRASRFLSSPVSLAITDEGAERSFGSSAPRGPKRARRKPRRLIRPKRQIAHRHPPRASRMPKCSDPTFARPTGTSAQSSEHDTSGEMHPSPRRQLGNLPHDEFEAGLGREGRLIAALPEGRNVVRMRAVCQTMVDQALVGGSFLRRRLMPVCLRANNGAIVRPVF